MKILDENDQPVGELRIGGMLCGQRIHGLLLNEKDVHEIVRELSSEDRSAMLYTWLRDCVITKFGPPLEGTNAQRLQLQRAERRAFLAGISWARRTENADASKTAAADTYARGRR